MCSEQHLRGLASEQQSCKEISRRGESLTTLRPIRSAWESNPRPPALIAVRLIAELTGW